MTTPALPAARSGVSRRMALKAMAAVTASSAIPGVAACRGRLSPALSLPSPVAILAAADYSIDFADLIGRALRELQVDVRGRRVLVKPNMVEFDASRPINSHPAVVGGTVVALRRAGAAEVIVGEGPGHRRDIEFLLQSTGLLDVLDAESTRFVDLNVDEVGWLTMAGGLMKVKRLAMPASLLAADFVVTLPKLKTHHWAGMTGSMKNLFGTVPGAVYGWPKNPLHYAGIANSILDLTASIRPGLAVVDAVVGMEGDGPIRGRARHVGALIVGTNPVAVDATCARLMGLEPHRLEFLGRAHGWLGSIDTDAIEQRGDAFRAFATQFQLLPVWQSARRPLRWWERALFSMRDRF